MYELLLQFDQRAAAMEPEVMGPEASWSAFDSAMSVDESEVMAQLLGSRGFSGSQDQQMLWPDHNGNAYDFSHDLNHYPYQWPQGNFSTCKDGAPAANYEGYYLSYPHEVPAVGVCSGPMNFSIGGAQIDTPSVPAGAYSAVCLNEARRDDDETGSCKRKGRASAAPLKKGRNARAKKAQKSENTCNDEERNGDTNPQSSCCYCSEEDGSQELNGAGTSATALNLNGKKQAAGRGSATAPQSLYARKRRERINERLRILQNLIPNGTKVDISTMLEEAVQYVKFLQLQIKLLSSDELWMYAPIAYNGVNLGFDLEISQKLQNDIQRR